MRRMMETRGITVGTWGITVGMRGISVGMWEIEWNRNRKKKRKKSLYNPIFFSSSLPGSHIKF